MTTTRVGIVDCGVGNIGSIANALSQHGFEVKRLTTGACCDYCSKIILPGVGAFGSFMGRLHNRGFIKSLISYTQNQSNLLIGICVGMQVLLEDGNEHGNHKGLGLIPGSVRHINELNTDKVRVPHVGWNNVSFKEQSLDQLNGRYYFTHSYIAALPSTIDVLATTQYGSEFPSALRRNNIVGFQFHPEKSGKLGAQLLANILSF